MLVYSNRAQAFLKLKCYQKAFDDADKAVTLDGTHIKSIGRRGTAAYHLGKYRLAKRDFETALLKDPANKQFVLYLEKAVDKLKKIKTEAYEKMTRSVMFTDLVQLGFEEQATSVYVAEMNLDEKQALQMSQKKEDVIA